MNEKMLKACDAFVRAVYNAKQRASHVDEFWADEEPNAAYQGLFKAIRNGIDSEIEWQSGVRDLTCSFADSVWEGDVAFEATLRRLASSLEQLLDDLSVIEWIACVPLERVFQRFPAFTDFGPFAIINARARAPIDQNALLNEFREILSDRLGVNFMPKDEVYESYLQIGDHYYQKSGYYIPGRPQLVIRTGKGEPRANERILKSKINSIAPLLQFCQIAIDLEGSLSSRIIGPHSVKADGRTHMEHGMTRLPSCCVALNKRTGHADWWPSYLSQHETPVGEGYEPDRFVQTWRELAVPILELRNAGLSGKLADAIDSALTMIGKCRHAEFGDLALHAVIATETILNPFNPSGDISERFALMAAALTETQPTARREAYKIARSLYRRRCQFVHRSRLSDEGDAKASQRQAVKLFVRCLLAVVRWATSKLAQGEKIKLESFDELYLKSVFPD